MQVLPVSVLCVLNDTLVAYKHGALYTYRFEPGKPLAEHRFLCRIPMSNTHRLMAYLPIFYRVFRTVPRAAAPVSDHEFILAFLGQIFRVDIRSGEIVTEHVFRKPMRAPISFAELRNVPGFSDALLYGEYHGNIDNGAMSVFARTANGDWTCVYTFPAGSVCHIHGFCPDTENRRVLILTGDTDEQSAIYVATDDFQHVEPLLAGSQQYRACVAFADKNGLLYATDTPLSPNAVYVYREGEQPQKIYELPGPCIFGSKAADGCYWLATSVEPDSRLPWYRYLLTRKLGAGVNDRYVHIVNGDLDEGFQTVLRMKKDWLPMTLCQFGNASFVPYENGMLIVPQSVFRYEGKTIYMERSTL